MKRVTPYLKMRVLGAIEFAPGDTIAARIRHLSDQVFTDDNDQRFQFTWRTIQTWYSRYKKNGITSMHPRARSDKGHTRKVQPEILAEAVDQVRANFHKGPNNITAVYRANLSESGVTGTGPHAGDPRIRRDREEVSRRLSALRERYQRRVDELKADARSARDSGDSGRALAAWREAGRIDPYDIDVVLREAETACAAGAWSEGRRAIAEALARMPGEPTLLRNLATVDRAIARHGAAR